MSSSEAAYARRAAMFYGPARVRLNRPDRISWLREQIANMENLRHREQEAHRANCDDCQRSAFCIELYTLSPADEERLNKLRFMNGLICVEEQDEAYAQRSRLNGVEYRHHIDGFCFYWQNVRHRKFVSVDWMCERCGKPGNLDAHHLHYDTLGFEELVDIQALCRKCHEKADEQRVATTRYNNALETYMEKKYGYEAGEWPEGAEEEFDSWLERKERTSEWG
jgi:hypothetical protein